MSTGDSTDRKDPLPKSSGSFAKGILERREVERVCDRKEAAHGFRDLSVIKIIPGFEQRLTDLKTKIDKFMNSLGTGEDQRHLEQISIQQKLQLSALDLHQALGNV